MALSAGDSLAAIDPTAVADAHPFEVARSPGDGA